MTAPMGDEVLRGLRSVKRLLLLTILATGLAITTQYLVSAEARERICDTVTGAFAVEHEELGKSFGLSVDDPKVRDLDERVQARLEECG